MKLSSVCLLSLAFALGTASPIAHQHHQHAKREAVVVTIYETVTAGEPTVAASTTSFDEYTPSTIGQVPQSTDIPSTLSTVLSSFSSSSSSSSSQAESAASSTLSQSQSSSTATGAAGVAAGAKGITYSPYSTSGSCKDSSEIQSDIAKLAGFEVIRVYAPDCSVIENILQAKSSSQKIFAGLYYLENIDSDVSTIKSAIEAHGSWDDISTVAVGNEWVNSGAYSVSQVSSAVTSARSALNSAGYSGDIVSVDTLVAVQNNPGLCDISDFIAVNSHPYWDGSCTASNAGPWLKEQISNIKSICGGSKDVLITETGWPSSGNSYGAAIPSESNQYDAVKSIVDSVGDQVLIFTMYNDYWKSAGDYNVEQSWGVFGDSSA